MTQEDIDITLDDYRKAARNAMKAGFDGVQIHSANGYLIDEFIQTCTNKREDKYGGSLEKRLQFLKEVFFLFSFFFFLFSFFFFLFSFFFFLFSFFFFLFSFSFSFFFSFSSFSFFFFFFFFFFSSSSPSSSPSSSFFFLPLPFSPSHSPPSTGHRNRYLRSWSRKNLDSVLPQRGLPRNGRRRQP